MTRMARRQYSQRGAEEIRVTMGHPAPAMTTPMIVSFE